MLWFRAPAGGSRYGRGQLQRLYHDPYAALVNCSRASTSSGQVQLWQFLLEELSTGAPGICWEVHGKRYAYRFCWAGLAAACQAHGDAPAAPYWPCPPPPAVPPPAPPATAPHTQQLNPH
ncbi:unnamed protein product [Leptidea sinapis]|uniref:ETS domain-containing protein n=1 Tax=Leptidea sinapis TaxID=189913 RepID=A0A5E4Q836_9NEOP|nr:unnamed protein product [Leptidea sinapis]